MHTNWDDLRHFLAVCEAGSLTGAARALGVEHTTVARRVEALELTLNAVLFDRLPRGWALTAAGRTLVPFARKIEMSVCDLWNAAVGSAGGLQGAVTITAPPALAWRRIAPHLAYLVRELPHVEVNLRAEMQMADLGRREADIALRFTRPEAPSMIVRSLGEVAYHLVGTPHYLQERSPSDWEFLGYCAQGSDPPQQRWLETYRGGRRYRFKSNDLDILATAARCGWGVALLPDYLVDRHDDELAFAAPRACPVKRTLWLVVHEDVRRAPHVGAVVEGLVGLFDSH
jgi:DNA-binding transcriptional LysR family regulator